MNAAIREGMVDYGDGANMKEEEDAKRKADAEKGLSEVAKLREVEQIIDTRQNEDGSVLCQVKWKSLGTEQCTWEPGENVLSKEEMKAHKKDNENEDNPFMSTEDAVSKLGKSAKRAEDNELDNKPKPKQSTKGMCSCCGSKDHSVRTCPLKEDMKLANADKANARMDLRTQMGRKQRG